MKRRVVVQLTRTTMRVLVVAWRRRRPLVTHWLVEPLHEVSLQAQVRRLMAPLAPQRAVCRGLLAQDQVLARVLTLPAARPEVAARMAALAAQAQWPCPADQLVTDVAVVDRQADRSTVQLMACRRAVADERVALVRDAGGALRVLTPVAWALAAWYRRCGAAVEEPTLLVHVDGDALDVTILRDARVLCGRSLRWPSAGDAVAARETAINEIERTLAGTQRTWPGVAITTTVVTGSGSLEAWRERLASRLGVAVTCIAADAPLALPPALHPEASPAALIGLALADDDDLPNLLPSSVRVIHRRQRQLRELLVTGALVLGALLAGLGLLGAAVTRHTRAIAQLAVQVRALESQTAHLQHRARLVRAAARQHAARREAVAALAAVLRLAPTDVWLESVALDRAGGILTVRGSAATTRQALDYLEALDQSRQWRRAELRSAARRATVEGARTVFELVLRACGA